MRRSLMPVSILLSICLAGCGSAEQQSTVTTESTSAAATGEGSSVVTVVDGTDHSAYDPDAPLTSATDTGKVPEPEKEALEKVYVEKIDGLSDDFIRGVDLSTYASEIKAGVIFRDRDGNALTPEAFMEQLKNAGINWVRLRVWNDPYDADGNGYGGGDCDINNAIVIGKLATDAGLRVLIDFHYSDFWADPDRQLVPKAWSGKDLSEKADALSAYTTQCLDKLLTAGVDVGMVQIGNETVNGIAGESDEDAMCRLFSAGSKAVRDLAAAKGADIRVAVHFTNPEEFSGIAAMLKKHGVDYDVFAASYYPYWHGTTEDLTSILSGIADTYGKEVLVAETSYPFTDEDSDGTANVITSKTEGLDFAYDISVQGQADALASVIRAVHAVDSDAGIGVFYWEPAWITVDPEGTKTRKERSALWETYGCGWASSYADSYDPDHVGNTYGGSGWDNQALFDRNGYPLDSLNVFSLVYTGQEVKEEAVGILPVSVSALAGEDPSLPDTVTVRFNTARTKEVPVTWDAKALQSAVQKGAGTWEISGSVDGYDLAAACTLTIAYQNLLKNPSFEDDSSAPWILQGPLDIQDKESDARAGDRALHFWSDSSFTFSAVQEVSVTEPGIYALTCYLQGGDAESSVFDAFAETEDGTILGSASVTPQGWAKFQEAKIDGITITAPCTIKVGVRGTCNAGAWGTFDDFSFCRVGD